MYDVDLTILRRKRFLLKLNNDVYLYWRWKQESQRSKRKHINLLKLFRKKEEKEEETKNVDNLQVSFLEADQEIHADS